MSELECDARSHVCQVTMCGRDGDEMWGDAPICTEHHQMRVAIQAARDEREHDAGRCSCSIFEPVEACHFYMQQGRNT